MKVNIAIIGAGSIGCYVGGRLVAAGANVTLVGRQRIGQALQQNGLTVTSYLGYNHHVPLGPTLQFSESTEAAKNADIALICVKSAATESLAKELKAILKPNTIVISLQNGLGNAATLRQYLNDQVCLAGMVQFNVINRGDGQFHQGSEGGLECEANPAMLPYIDCFDRSGLGMAQPDDFLSIQWAKLLLNLNNPINALSGLPLKQELSERDFRRCLSKAQSEALHLLAVAKIKPAKLTPLPPAWIPKLLKVPTWAFKLLANKMLAIDPLARSSMWEDLEAGRKTEVDYINGEVVQLAAQLNRHAPVNQKLIELIKAAEDGGKRDWAASDLLAAVNYSTSVPLP